MKKILLLIFLLMRFFSFAQEPEVDTTDTIKTYRFNFSMDINCKTVDKEDKLQTKLINNKDDHFMAVVTDDRFLQIFDFNLQKNHLFILENSEDKTEYVYINSNDNGLDLKSITNAKVQIKKLTNTKYILTKFRTDNNLKIVEILIDIEKSASDMANSFNLQEMLNLNIEHINKLRNYQKEKPFIIRSYEANYAFHTIKCKIFDEKKIDITISLPKILVEKN